MSRINYEELFNELKELDDREIDRLNEEHDCGIFAWSFFNIVEFGERELFYIMTALSQHKTKRAFKTANVKTRLVVNTATGEVIHGTIRVSVKAPNREGRQTISTKCFQEARTQPKKPIRIDEHDKIVAYFKRKATTKFQAEVTTPKAVLDQREAERDARYRARWEKKRDAETTHDCTTCAHFSASTTTFKGVSTENKRCSMEPYGEQDIAGYPDNNCNRWEYEAFRGPIHLNTRLKMYPARRKAAAVTSKEEA